MSRRSVLKTAPIDYPITLAQAKAQLKLETDFTDDDALVTLIISGITDVVQDMVQRQLMQASWYYYLDSWNDLDNPVIKYGYSRELSGQYLKLPKAPLVSITSIKYLDSTGAGQTLDPSIYQVDDKSEPARIRFTGNLPTLADEVAAVTIEYLAGYPGADAATQQAAIPAKIKLWMLANIGTLYQNRQTIVAGRLDNINDYMLNLLGGARLFL